MEKGRGLTVENMDLCRVCGRLRWLKQLDREGRCCEGKPLSRRQLRQRARQIIVTSSAKEKERNRHDPE